METGPHWARRLVVRRSDAARNRGVPVIVAAVICDFRRNIVWMHGAVSCVYTDARKDHLS